jgi:hypothetical protein
MDGIMDYFLVIGYSRYPKTNCSREYPNKKAEPSYKKVLLENSSSARLKVSPSTSLPSTPLPFSWLTVSYLTWLAMYNSPLLMTKHQGQNLPDLALVYHIKLSGSPMFRHRYIQLSSKAMGASISIFQYFIIQLTYAFFGRVSLPPVGKI